MQSPPKKKLKPNTDKPKQNKDKNNNNNKSLFKEIKGFADEEL